MEAPTKVDKTNAPEQLGGGAQFWTYISPANDTEKLVTQWRVRVTQQDGNWVGEMTSDGQWQAQSPGLSGTFNLEVQAIVGSNPEWQTLTPVPDTKPGIIGCNDNCASMIGIVADKVYTSRAYYWTTWDAMCS